VIPELSSRGHDAIAVDMPIDEPRAGWSEYADAVVDVISDDVPVVVVGHSLGGHVIPIVAERAPVQMTVFLAGGLPVEESFSAMMEKHPDHFQPDLVEKLEFAEDGATTWRAEDAIGVFYNDCERQDAERAVAQLRKQYLKQVDQPYPLEKFPNAPSTYIVCTEDRAITPAWQRRVPAELGMDLVEIDASHSPFWSRPSDLAHILASVV
jgi:pimeloyl-ACP methyl ester carboxylesterase